MPRNRTLVPLTFFLCLFGYMVWLALAYSPVVHFESDGLAMRGTGTLLPYLLSRDDPLYSLVVGIMAHLEGPLQYLFINLYCYFIGDILPLTPATMAFPNAVFALAICIMVFILCRALISSRVAYCAVVAFTLFPWLCFTMRQPWYFNLLSCLLQTVTLFCYISHLKNLESRAFRIMAPASLAFYVLNCLDWPSFLLCLLFFCIMYLRRNASVLLWNPYNLIPVACALLMVAWSAAVTTKYGLFGLIQSRFVYPFYRALQGTTFSHGPGFQDATLFAWGPQLILALVGGCIYLSRDRKRANYTELTKSFLDTMCFWFVAVGIVIAIASDSPSFLYVLAIPTAVLTGISLARIRSPFVLVPVLVLMAGFQVKYNMNEKHLYGFTSDDRARLAAAACYVVDARPDLLSGERTPVVTQGEAQVVAQYARPATRNIRIPTRLAQIDVPTDAQSKGSGPRSFAFALKAYGGQDLHRPWIVMSTDVLQQAARSFGRQLLEDPDISWFAQFRDPNGETTYLGEYTPGTSRVANEAPSMDVPSLSKRWLDHYDRIRFLQHNVQYLRHY